MANSERNHPSARVGVCPSCGEKSEFECIGIQHWPPKVAKLRGVPAEQTVWRCLHCDTSLMASSLSA